MSLELTFENPGLDEKFRDDARSHAENTGQVKTDASNPSSDPAHAIAKPGLWQVSHWLPIDTVSRPGNCMNCRIHKQVHKEG